VVALPYKVASRFLLSASDIRLLLACPGNGLGATGVGGRRSKSKGLTDQIVSVKPAAIAGVVGVLARLHHPA
jgi:hypothetical protein